MNRNDPKIKVDVFYVSRNGEVFITPDGFGGYWYDTLELAIAEHGDYPVIRTTEIME